MAHQIALTIITRIAQGQVEALKERLGTIQEHPNGQRDVVAFGNLDNVHFARLFVCDPAQDLNGDELPAQLIMLTNADAPEDRHIRELAEICGDGLDRVFCHCEGYPSPEQRSPETRADFVRSHRHQASAVYVNRNGRSVRQVRQEEHLRQRINEFLDATDFTGATPEQVREAITDWVRDNPELHWALSPAESPGLGWRLREALHRYGSLLVVLALSPLLLGLPVFLLLLRAHERRDQPDTSSASPEAVRELRDDEDYWAHNQVVALGLFKPGLFRLVVSRVILRMTDYACRHIYNRGVLSGLNTIHFARWAPLDNGRRLFFSSNYDGSLESYMNDFIDKAAWGLNAIFSHGDGFPSTRFLFCGGITDEQAYKRFLPTRQLQTQVWYSGYPHLTTKNIANNAAIRAGLSQSLDDDEIRVWLRRFGVGNQLPESGLVARFLDGIRWDRLCKGSN